MNNRRKLLVALGASALAAPLASFAQQQGKVWRVGFLGFRVPPGYADPSRHSGRACANSAMPRAKTGDRVALGRNEDAARRAWRAELVRPSATSSYVRRPGRPCVPERNLDDPHRHGGRCRSRRSGSCRKPRAPGRQCHGPTTFTPNLTPSGGDCWRHVPQMTAWPFSEPCDNAGSQFDDCRRKRPRRCTGERCMTSSMRTHSAGHR